MSSLNVLWRMLAVDLRFGAREVAGRFGAEALQLHRVERPRAQRHRHRGGVREAAGHRGTPPCRQKAPAVARAPLPPQPLWPSMTPQRSARPVARGARRSGARRPRCEHAPPSTTRPGGPGSPLSSRTCTCSRRASSRTCAPPGPTPRATRCSQPWSHGQKSDFLDRSAPLGVTRGQDRDFLDQLQSHSTCYDRKASVLPALFSPPLSARGQNRSRKSSFCPQGAS